MIVSRIILAWLLACAAVTTFAQDDEGEEDRKAHERAQHEFRRSGFNWMTPLQYHNLDKKTNTKPYLFQFLSSRCWVCNGFLEHLATKEDPTWLNNLSSQFNAVFISDYWGWQYVTPDYTEVGKGYVPHTVFAWPNGTIRTDLMGHSAFKPEDKYYYQARDLLWQMWQILQEQYNKTEPYPADLDDDL